MPEHDLHSEIKVLKSTAPIVSAVALVGAEIDTEGYQGCEFVILTGIVGTGTCNPIIHQSPDDGSGSPTGVWTAVPADEIIGGIASGVAGELGLIDAGDDGAIFRFGTIGKERWQRLTLPETSGDWVSFIVASFCILSNPRTKPVADQGAPT